MDFKFLPSQLLITATFVLGLGLQHLTARPSDPAENHLWIWRGSGQLAQCSQYS